MNPDTLLSWQLWAILSAVFAALTAIFAKVGVADINSDLATFIRTIVVLVAISADQQVIKRHAPASLGQAFHDDS